MEKTSKTILSLIISFLVTYSLIVPTAHIFGLEDSTSANSSVDPSVSTQSATTTEQTSTDSAQDGETTSKNEPQKADDVNSEQETTKQSEQTDKASSSTDRTPISKQSEQTTKASSSTDRTPPGRVGTVTVKVISGNQIDLKWTGVKDSDLNHYNIYRGTKSSFKVSPGVTVPSGTSTTNFYSLTGLKPYTKYYVKIAAVDNSGNIGTLSSAKSGRTNADDSTQTDGPPQKVGGLSVSSISSTQLNLKWSANKESDFSHYNVYKGTKSSFTVTLGTTPPAGTSTTNSYSSNGLNPSTTYYYKVAAVDKAGHIGSPSSGKSGKTKPGPSGGGNGNDTTPPAQVTGLTVSTVSTSQLNLAWNQNSESDFNHYNIYKGTSDGFSVTPGITSPAGTSTTNSYSSTGLSPSTKYYYRVAAVDKTGNIGQLSSQASKTTATPPPPPPPPSDTTPPAQVTGLTVSTVSTSQLNLAWNQNSESDFNHYNVYRGTSSAFSVTPGVTSPAGTSTANSYSSTGLSPSTTYYYKVAAVDNAGNIGSLSSERSGTTATPADTTPPAQVTGLLITTVGVNQLDLDWNQNVESDFNHYNVYRGTSSNFAVTLGTTPPTGTSTANSYSSTGLSPSTTYYYKVAAVDNAGNIGSLSSERSGTTATPADTTPPTQVTGLTVSTVSTSQLNLAWNQNSESDFNHYNVYRGTSSGFSVTPGVTSPAGTSTANSYSSTGLSPSTTYYYKVAAVDNAGNIGPLSSEKSGITTSSSSGNVYDDFEGATYKLAGGQKSPNGKWLSKWTAGGEMGVNTENGNNVFYGFPQTPTQSGETHSSFAISTQKFSDMTLDLDMKTYKQLRQNSPANTWETAWVMWRWTDLFHHYYFVIKTNGIEFGKKDTSCSCEQQVFLKTGSSPTVKLNTWDHIKISSVGKHTTIWVDGTKVVDMDDPSYSSTADMSGGYIGLYSEDASVAFDKVTVTPQ